MNINDRNTRRILFILFSCVKLWKRIVVAVTCSLSWKWIFRSPLTSLIFYRCLTHSFRWWKMARNADFEYHFSAAGKNYVPEATIFLFFSRYEISDRCFKKFFFFSSKFDFWVIYWLICRWRISSCDMRLFFFYLKKWYRIINLAKFFFINSIKILSIYSVFITGLALLLNIIIHLRITQCLNIRFRKGFIKQNYSRHWIVNLSLIKKYIF